jgi:hypothetical protein
VLRDYELPRGWIRPALGICRTFNTALDKAFYDVEAFECAADTQDTGAGYPDNSTRADLTGVDLSADTNPEGSLLVVNAAARPYVQQFRTIEDFRRSTDGEVGEVRIASIAGVGSSALGSAALAWDVSTAFNAPVLAIVAGYGLADALLQGLGGWFGYGVHDAINTKAMLQQILVATSPATASVGRSLSAPIEPKVGGAPVFERGSGSADVLHALLREFRFSCLVGHSKGALTIGNALGSLPSNATADLRVITLGCPIAPAVEGVRYAQFLGAFDTLGMLNSWWHSPTEWIESIHSTNSIVPLSMQVRDLCARFAPLA